MTLNHSGDKILKMKPIGVIHSPFKQRSDAPHQGIHSEKTSYILIFDEYKPGLEGMKKYRYLIILYWLDQAERDLLKVVPHGRSKKRGVFTTRAPSRPNPVGLAVVELLNLTENKLTVKGLDAIDGTPVIDIKPYSKELDYRD